MKSLVELITALPAELYDKIYDETFTAASVVPTIDTTYKPPACAQVDRHSRELFASSYYSHGSIFEVEKDCLEKWTKSLPLRTRQVQMPGLIFYVLGPPVIAFVHSINSLLDVLVDETQPFRSLDPRVIRLDVDNQLLFNLNFGMCEVRLGDEYQWMTVAQVTLLKQLYGKILDQHETSAFAWYHGLGRR